MGGGQKYFTPKEDGGDRADQRDIKKVLSTLNCFFSPSFHQSLWVFFFTRINVSLHTSLHLYLSHTLSLSLSQSLSLTRSLTLFPCLEISLSLSPYLNLCLTLYPYLDISIHIFIMELKLFTTICILLSLSNTTCSVLHPFWISFYLIFLIVSELKHIEGMAVIGGSKNCSPFVERAERAPSPTRWSSAR